MVNLRQHEGKFIVLLLIILIIKGDMVIYSQDLAENLYFSALEYYHHGLYNASISMLEELLDVQVVGIRLTSRIYMLLGFCYSQLHESKNASSYFRQVKVMLDVENISEIPEIQGVDAMAFPDYQRVLGGMDYFRYNEPILVSRMFQGNVIHVPRKRVIEQEKKKHFPWLVVAGFTALVSAVLLTKQDKGKATFDEVDWVRIPAGEFLMGDNFMEGNTDERPVHRVYLDDYFISKYEISIKQYNYFCRETGRRGVAFPSVVGTDTSAGMGRYPVIGVSWNDATAFCSWLSGRLGRKTFLPSEAQWEKAARGDTQRKYPWGDGNPDCNLANYIGCASKGNIPGEIKPTGFSPSGASVYGVCEMAGNAAEWCRDFYGAHYYETSPVENPKGPDRGMFRVVRGGSCFDVIRDIRSAARAFYDSNYTHSGIGFRVVMER